ncbi:MAG TPA: hypothetical protein VH502_00405 [Actinoplanes sp.]|jgi:hypothetical protein
MATAELSGIVELSRAVVSAAAELVAGVERAMAGDGNVRTARGNAWDALQADRARAQARADMDRVVASLLATGPRHRPPSGTTIPPRDLGVVVGANRAIGR